MKRIFLLYTLSVIIIFSSCTIRQEIFIDETGGGTYSGDIKVSEEFSGYLGELASLNLEAQEEFTLFEPETIKSDLEANQTDISVTKIHTEDKNTLHVEMAFSSIEDLIASEEAFTAGIVELIEHPDGRKTLHIHMDRDNYQGINELFPEEERIVMETFGPAENEGLTEEDYLEMMSFALGDNGPDLIRQSIIETRVRVDGTILEQKGGSREGNAVVFRIPLIRILLLDQPLDYLLTFK